MSRPSTRCRPDPSGTALLIAAALLLAPPILASCTPLPTAQSGPSGTATVTSRSKTPVPDPAASTVSSAAPAPDPAPAGAGAASAALAALAAIPVKGRAAKTGYARTQFGQRWSDAVDVELGRNGCDTRNDILRRDLTEVTAKAGTRGCVVASGTLTDPYTGETVAFTRGEQTSSLVQIDHVVALSDAWQKGTQQLPVQRRTELANDPRNLQATQGRINQAKGDADAASWLPPDRSYRCTYVARQIEVKAAYGLWVTAAEKDAMTRVLTGCGGHAGESGATG